MNKASKLKKKSRLAESATVINGVFKTMHPAYAMDLDVVDSDMHNDSKFFYNLAENEGTEVY